MHTTFITLLLEFIIITFYILHLCVNAAARYMVLLSLVVSGGSPANNNALSLEIPVADRWVFRSRREYVKETAATSCEVLRGPCGGSLLRMRAYMWPMESRGTRKRSEREGINESSAPSVLYRYIIPLATLYRHKYIYIYIIYAG